MVESADSWKRDDVPKVRRFRRASRGSITVQGHVRTIGVVIAEILVEASQQMPLVQDD